MSFNSSDRLVGEVIDGGACGLQQYVHRSGRRLRFIPVGRGDDIELTTKTMILFTLSSGVGTPSLCRASRNDSASSTPRMPRLSETAAVHEMDVRPPGAVEVGLRVPQPADRARCRSRRVRGVDIPFGPRRNDVVAGAAIVVERDRGEHHGYGRRCRGGAGQPYAIEIRAKYVKSVLGECQSVAGRQVGGRCHDEGAVAAIEIAEGRAVEQDLVVQLRRQFGTAPAGRRQVPQYIGDKVRLMISPWTLRLRKRCS